MVNILKNLIFWYLLSSLLIIPSISNAKQSSQYTLNNGLKVILKEDHSHPVVLLQLWYKVGFGYESLANFGISKILQQKISSPKNNYYIEALKKLLFKKGDKYDSYIGTDHTVYSHIIAPQDIELALELEANCMQNLFFNETDFQEIKLEDVKKWYKNWYTPKKAILIIAGDINLINTNELVRQYFENIVVNNDTNYNSEIFKDSLIDKFGGLSIKVPSLNTTKIDWEPFAIELLVAILRNKNNMEINYNPFSKRETAIMFYDNNVLLTQHINWLKCNLVPMEELINIKTKLLLDSTYQQESILDYVNKIGQLEVAGYNFELIKQRDKEINKITAKQIQQVAKKYLYVD